jgi:NADPH:quinone reductase-like Zn-dependent oxidoreductase
MTTLVRSTLLPCQLLLTKSYHRADYYDHVPTPCQILGYDGAGIVRALGPDCSSGLRSGDAVFFSCSPFRHGANAARVLVDEVSLARKPARLDFVEAAAMPLTWLTAYEALVERLEIKRAERAAILIINGAGGKGLLKQATWA